MSSIWRRKVEEGGITLKYSLGLCRNFFLGRNRTTVLFSGSVHREFDTACDVTYASVTQRVSSRVQPFFSVYGDLELKIHQTMPPRRSARSVRASVEPESNSTKRKRPDGDDVEEKENALGTRRTSTRSSVGPSSKASAKPPSGTTARTSSRRNRVLDEVAEIEEEEPEKKKSRKSVEGEDEDEDDEIVELPKPRRGRVKKIVQDDDEVQEVKPPRRSSAKPRSTQSRKTAKVEVSDDEELKDIITISEDDEEVKPTRRSSAKSRPTRSRKPILISEDEEEEIQEVTLDPNVTPRPRNSFPAVPLEHNSPVAEDDMDDLDGFQEEFHQTPRRAPRQSQQSQATPKRPAPPLKEEEEMSLLEPRVRPTSVMQPPAPEEQSGPKPRLVIHKMVLVNFKSYAGRQEIGPFHKV